MNRRNMFDRVSLYRWAALALSVSVVSSIYTLAAGTMPWTGWRVALWVGYGVLMFAVLRDAWIIYRARRSMHHKIEKAMQEG